MINIYKFTLFGLLILLSITAYNLHYEVAINEKTIESICINSVYLDYENKSKFQEINKKIEKLEQQNSNNLNVINNINLSIDLTLDTDAAANYDDQICGLRSEIDLLKKQIEQNQLELKRLHESKNKCRCCFHKTSHNL